MSPKIPTSAEQLDFLRAQLALGGVCRLVETHSSWVLLGTQHVYKVKKPACSTLFDFSTPQARARNAREETRLNRRLAADVYLGVLALQWDGSLLHLVPEEARNPAMATLDSVVWMKRLPDDAMVNTLLICGSLTPRHVNALMDVLVPFYRRADPAPCSGLAYVSHLRREQAVNREVLCRPAFALPIAPTVLDRLDDALTLHEATIRQRAGRLVDGHGDLRPEHVCMLDPPVVIDALEFNARLRQIDPFDELAYLGLECTMAGAPWVAGQLETLARQALADEPPAPLWHLYAALRAALRARLCAAHLLDEHPRTPDRWLPLAQRYLVQIAMELKGMRATS
ncbi:hypothetical protein [Piscinibacter gummiphilus]|uniref:Aminoglycoside phosphotransferase domain-containing protein n=1 Tax=Piscinibacter gummiphilus TaxID=946333 RepID=A0ABZ0CQZ2_9BURK|nr:hypothetical protein [Piscinibacter gummiphilus]WOB07399.1 hypothetical protein RXV79_21085 [Piscinibacter gummiphilus]